MAAFVDLLAAENVRSYGEIGARDGDTFHHVMTALPVGATGVALDLPDGVWGSNKSRAHLEAVIADLRKRGYQASGIFGDSKAAGTLKLFKGRGPYDAILIDGDHRLEGVTADWMAYRGMARIIAFHDIAGEGQRARHGNHPVEVPLLWQKIRREHHATAEFISEGSRMGIGVVWMQ